ncbi:MAG: hypothetical protein ABW182_01035 [Sphingomonas sp.]
MTRNMAAIGLAAMLTACGGNARNAADTAAQASGVTAAAGSEAVLDACAHVDRVAIERNLGVKIQSAELSAVRDGSTGNGDRFSQCAFNFGGMDMLIVGTGISHGSPSVAEQVETMRAEMKMASNMPAEAVTGVGKAALWNPELHGLYVFPGDRRYLALTLHKVGAPDQKAAAIALARALGV